MTSINRVIMVGNIIAKPEVLETSGKKKYVKFKLETWNFRRINGDVKKLTAQHTVLCFNQMAQSFLETVAVGTRIHLTGELDYDRQGNAQVIVPQYVGDIGAMDIDADETAASETKPATAKPSTPVSRPATSSGFSSPMSRPATSATPAASTPFAAKAGGGLGRLPLRKGSQAAAETSDGEATPVSDVAKAPKNEPKNRFLDSDGLDDSIPY